MRSSDIRTLHQPQSSGPTCVCFIIYCVFCSSAEFPYANSQPNTFSLIASALCECVSCLLMPEARVAYMLYMGRLRISLQPVTDFCYKYIYIYIYVCTNIHVYVNKPEPVHTMSIFAGWIFGQSFLGPPAWRRYREVSELFGQSKWSKS